MKYLLLPLCLIILACVEPAGTGGPTSPSDNGAAPPVGLAPVAPGPLSSLVSCSGLINVGNVVKVNSNPATHTSTGPSFWVTGEVIRDNAGVPGVQFYCEDTNTQVDWDTFSEGNPYCLTPIDVGPTHSWKLQHTCPTGPTRRAIAIPKNAAGTTIISTLRDTTVVFP